MRKKLSNLLISKRPGALPRWMALVLAIHLPLRVAGATLDDGLIAYYPFNGNANDASTNGNNGVVVGAQLTTDRNGTLNQAYLFNGTGDYINIGKGVKPNFPLTITAWIYPTPAASPSYTIFRSGTFSNSTGNYNGVMFGYDSRGFLYGTIGSGPASDPSKYRSYQATYPANAIPLNQWTHVALAWVDFQTTKFYVNGALQNGLPTGDSSSGTAIVNTATDGAIGIRDNPGYPAPFTGKLDEIRVYSRELSTNEIGTLAIEPPQVTIQPTSVTTNAGATVAFTANASGAAPLSYQWQFQSTNISGANGGTLTLANVKPADSGTYHVIVSNSVGTNTADATLTVSAQALCAMPPVFTNGIAFTVAINVAPPGGTTFYTVQDQPPAGWAVANISSPGSLSSGKVRWILTDGSSRTLSYSITPPASAGGTNHFTGTAVFNGATTIPVTGVRDIYNEALRLTVSAVDLFGDGVLYPKLTIFGTSGSSYHVLASDGLEPTNPWHTNATVTLNGPSQDWLDAEPMTNGRRFYKAQAAP